MCIFLAKDSTTNLRSVRQILNGKKMFVKQDVLDLTQQPRSQCHIKQFAYKEHIPGMKTVPRTKYKAKAVNKGLHEGQGHT